MSCTNTHATVGEFRAAVQAEAERLGGHCSTWRKVCDGGGAIPEDALGDIHVAIGQAELLKKERFTQFIGLIDNCEFKKGEKETTIQDLQGFWDIVYFQIDDIAGKFKGLEERRARDWQEADIPKPAVLKPKSVPVSAPAKKAPAPSGPRKARPGQSALRAHIMAQRSKMAAQSSAQPLQPLAPANAAPKSPASKAALKSPASKTAPCLKVTSPAKAATAAKTPVKTPTKGKDKENIPEKSLKLSQSPGKNTFDAGFFKITTPSKSRSASESVTPVKKDAESPRVLSSALLKEQVRLTPLRHKDYSPCMRITRSMKRLHLPQQD